MRITAFGERAIIDCVRVAGNPEAEKDIEAALRKYRILHGIERLAAYEELRDFARAGGESYGAVFRLAYTLGDNPPYERVVYAKAIVTGFGEAASEQAVRIQRARLYRLSSWHIRTPVVYGGGRGTLYLEHIEGHPPDPVRHLEDIARIAAILDVRGARAVGFLSDLVERGGELYYVDAGSDLGHLSDDAPPNADRPALRTLLGSVAEADRRKAQDCYLRHHELLLTAGGAR